METWVIRPKRHRLDLGFLLGTFLKRPKEYDNLRPMPCMAISAAGGVWCAFGTLRIFLIPAAVFFICLLCSLIRFEKKWISYAIPVTFLITSIRTGIIVIPAVCQAKHLEGEIFRLEGTVCEVLVRSEAYTHVLVRQKNGIRISFCVPGKSMAEGMVIVAQVCGKLPDRRRNPGGFDQADWLGRKGVFLEGSLNASQGFEIIDKDPGYMLVMLGSRLREKISSQLSDLLGDEESALLSGLLLGDDKRLSDASSVNFRKAGLSHLTSASGSNVAYWLLPLSILFKSGRLRRKLRLWLLLAALVCFGILTGWPVSVTRAIIMSSAFLIASLAGRRDDSLNSLCLAVLAILLFQPLSALTTGFWMSAAASGSMIMMSDSCLAWIKRRVPFIPFFLASGISASVCAQTALLPMTASIGREISLMSLISNIPAVPISGAIIMCSAILLPVALLLQAFIPEAACGIIVDGFSFPVKFLLDVLLKIADMAADCSKFRMFSNHLNAAFWLLWAFLLLGWLGRIKGDYFSNSFRKKLFLTQKLMLPTLVAFLLVSATTGLFEPDIQVWFLDVGQGDAILIHSQEGWTALIDGGNPGCGSRILSPALDALGINRIDLAVATHGHADHCGGLIELANDHRIDHLVVLSGSFSRIVESENSPYIEEDIFQKLKFAADANRIKVSEIKRNDTIALGSQIRFSILYPESVEQCSETRDKELDGNERSLLIQARLAGFQLLLAADCTESMEQDLLNQDTWPASDFLKVAHHGSSKTTSEEFLDKVQPEAAIISVGSNLYGHPSEDTLSRLEQAGCSIFRTDLHGAVCLEINRQIQKKSNWRISTMLP